MEGSRDQYLIEALGLESWQQLLISTDALPQDYQQWKWLYGISSDLKRRKLTNRLRGYQFGRDQYLDLHLSFPTDERLQACCLSFFANQALTAKEWLKLILNCLPSSKLQRFAIGRFLEAEASFGDCLALFKHWPDKLKIRTATSAPQKIKLMAKMEKLADGWRDWLEIYLITTKDTHLHQRAKDQLKGYRRYYTESLVELIGALDKDTDLAVWAMDRLRKISQPFFYWHRLYELSAYRSPLQIVALEQMQRTAKHWSDWLLLDQCCYAESETRFWCARKIAEADLSREELIGILSQTREGSPVYRFAFRRLLDLHWQAKKADAVKIISMPEEKQPLVRFQKVVEFIPQAVNE